MHSEARAVFFLIFKGIEPIRRVQSRPSLMVVLPLSSHNQIRLTPKDQLDNIEILTMLSVLTYFDEGLLMEYAYKKYLPINL